MAHSSAAGPVVQLEWNPPGHNLGLQIQRMCLLTDFLTAPGESTEHSCPEGDLPWVQSGQKWEAGVELFWRSDRKKTTKLPTCPVLPPSVLGNKAVPFLDKKVSLPTQWLFHQSLESKD